MRLKSNENKLTISAIFNPLEPLCPFASDPTNHGISTIFNTPEPLCPFASGPSVCSAADRDEHARAGAAGLDGPEQPGGQCGAPQSGHLSRPSFGPDRGRRRPRRPAPRRQEGAAILDSWRHQVSSMSARLFNAGNSCFPYTLISGFFLSRSRNDHMRYFCYLRRFLKHRSRLFRNPMYLFITFFEKAHLRSIFGHMPFSIF